MKRILVLLLALSLLLSLTACGQKVDPASVPGTQEGRVYTNSFFHLQCTAPVGWEFSTREELAEYNEITLDEFNNTAYNELLEKCDDELYDMSLTSPTGANANLIIVGSASVYNAMNEQKLAEKLLQDITDSYKKEDTDPHGKVENVTFLGQEKPSVRFDLEYEGSPYSETVLALKGTGSYFAYLAIFYVDEADLTEILSLFSKLS